MRRPERLSLDERERILRAVAFECDTCRVLDGELTLARVRGAARLMKKKSGPARWDQQRPGRVATFAEFLERRKIEVLTKQQPSSARAVRSHLKCYIIPQLGKLHLEDFGAENQQTFITRVFEKGA